jgi:hypothetical protein
VTPKLIDMTKRSSIAGGVSNWSTTAGSRGGRAEGRSASGQSTTTRVSGGRVKGGAPAAGAPLQGFVEAAPRGGEGEKRPAAREEDSDQGGQPAARGGRKGRRERDLARYHDRSETLSLNQGWAIY